MSNIKAVFFDFDGVLTKEHHGSIEICKGIQRHAGGDLEKIISCFERMNAPWCKGERDITDDWETFISCAGINLDSASLPIIYSETSKNEEMFQLITRLRGHVRLGIITDNLRDRIEVLKKTPSLSEFFELIISSSEVHLFKNNPAIFEKALTEFGIRPDEAVFIDNREKNLITPKQMGIHTYYFDFEKNDVAGLEIWLRDKGISF